MQLRVLLDGKSLRHSISTDGLSQARALTIFSPGSRRPNTREQGDMSTRLLWVAAVFLAFVTQSAAAWRPAQQQEHPRLKNGTTTFWPSLRFHFMVKRSPMKVHGLSAFAMLASPVVSEDGSPNVLYDTFATFTEDSTVYNYTLVDGIAYASRSSPGGGNSPAAIECANSDSLPSINSIAAALSEASGVSSISASGRDIECPNGDWFKVSVNGIDFGLCYSGSSGFSMHGSDMDINVEYVDNILVPALDVQCEKVATCHSATAIGKSLLTGEAFSSENRRRMLKAALDFSLDISPSCSCKSTPRPCIFIHGQGIKTEMPDNQNSFPTRYWGNMTDHASCCTSVKFAVLNTVNHSWTEDAQQQKVCERALAVSETSVNSRISDTIIVTHSMGALMLGGAIATGKCSLAPSTTWVSTGAPMRGSMGSDYLQGLCDGGTNVIVEKVANITGRCPVSAAIQSLAYENEHYASSKLKVAYEAAQQVYRTHVKAAMCSYKNSGLISSYQWQFWLLGKVVPHKSPHNDGMVEFYSCAGGIPESKFGNNYRDEFYVTKLNHFDVAFQGGDALLDEAKMPVKWFECLL
ncbi:hypothetical protein PHYPSEUDO_006177 [Phytophthora pseudosyringae]|uniref:Uncharacterized protein n=1 Tax=Phytophthora pseudosyringae TaxID=221518 RepID=A0A8T1VJF9_9STRA|nr:hypothetical protein PHYPSEUDO_006177 [Phytophthora pseudosyringae]